MGAVIQAPSLKAVDVESLSGYILSDGSSALVVRPWVILISPIILINKLATTSSASKKTF